MKRFQFTFDSFENTSGWSWCFLSCRAGNLVLLQFLVGLKQATEDDLVADLVVNVLKTCPDILSRYFKETQYSYTPRLRSAWQDNVKLLKKVNVVAGFVGLFMRVCVDDDLLCIFASDLWSSAWNLHCLSKRWDDSFASLAIHDYGDICSSSLQQSLFHTGPQCKPLN